MEWIIISISEGNPDDSLSAIYSQLSDLANPLFFKLLERYFYVLGDGSTYNFY